jgi:hypothetical protein
LNTPIIKSIEAAKITQPAHAQLVVLFVAICESLLESCGYIDAHVGTGTAHHPEKVSPPLSAASGRPGMITLRSPARRIWQRR